MKAYRSPSASSRRSLQKTRSASSHSTSGESWSLAGAERVHGATRCALSRAKARRRQSIRTASSNGFCKVAADSQAQHALPDAIFRISRDQDRRDRVPRRDQMLVKLGTRHGGHVHVSDQAVGSPQLGGCEELSRGREHRDGVAVRLEQSSHGVAKGLVVIDDGDQGFLGHDSFRWSLAASTTCPTARRVPRCCQGYCRSDG